MIHDNATRHESPRRQCGTLRLVICPCLPCTRSHTARFFGTFPGGGVAFLHTHTKRALGLAQPEPRGNQAEARRKEERRHPLQIRQRALAPRLHASPAAAQSEHASPPTCLRPAAHLADQKCSLGDRHDHALLC